MNKIYDCAGDYSPTPNDLKMLINSLKKELEDLKNTTEAKLLFHDGKIAELCMYLKTNLSNSIRCLLDTMLASGELENIIRESVNNYYYQLPNMVNVKSFGAVDDGISNSSKAFSEAIDYMKMEGITGLYIPTGTYLIDTFIIPENTIVYGCGSTLLLNLYDNVDICSFGSGSTIKDLHFKSLNVNREWNRLDMSNQKNITIENCSVEGFRNPGKSNAWGLYMKNSKNIHIKNCEFDNNTQSDIAITENSENIIIENCKPLKDYMRVNSEPNGTGEVKNVMIKGSKISFLTILGNSPTRYNNQDFKLYDNVIDELMLQNCSIELVNNDIKKLRTTLFSNKIIKNINSIGYGVELNNDIHLVNIQPSNTEDTNCWKMGYSNKTNSLKRANTSKGKILQLNPDLVSCACSIERTFKVSSGEQYAIETLMNTIHPADSGASGRGLNIFFYDVNGDVLEKNNYLVDRSDIDLTKKGETEWAEKTTYITIPETATEMRILVSNYTTSSGKYGTNWGSIKIHKISLSNRHVSEGSHETTGPAIPQRINAFGDYNLSLKGDIIYLTNGSEFAAVCSESGNPGVWKKVHLD